MWGWEDKTRICYQENVEACITAHGFERDDFIQQEWLMCVPSCETLLYCQSSNLICHGQIHRMPRHMSRCAARSKLLGCLWCTESDSGTGKQSFVEYASVSVEDDGWRDGILLNVLMNSENVITAMSDACFLRS